MDKFLDSKWFLRFTALFLAIILFYSIRTDDGNLNGASAGDQQDVIHDVPVDVYYDNENLVVTGVPETVKVAIEGPINIVQTTKLLKDFSLVLDLRTLTMGKHTVQIKSENISEKLQVRIDPASVDVVIEEKVTETFKVEPEFNERQLADDFSVINMEVTPSTIEVTGAKSVIESINFVKATVSGEKGINKSFEQQAKVRVLDKDLNKLDVTVVPDSVAVKVEVVENNKEVPISLKAIGTPPDGVVIDSLSAEQESITLYGPSQVLNEINDLVVEVDVSKMDGPGTLEVDIKKPKGITELSISKLKVDVKATVDKTETDADDESAEGKQDDDALADKEEIAAVEVVEAEDEIEVEEDAVDDAADADDTTSTETISFDNVPITVTGLDKKFASTLLKPKSGLITLTVIAEPDVAQKLKVSDFNLSIDASAVADEGEQIYPITVEGPTNIQWTLSEKEVTMMVELA